MKSIFTFFLVFCLLIGCNKSPKYEYIIIEEFPEYDIKQGDIIRSINAPALMDLTIIDTFLVIISKMDNSYIQVYSTVSNELIGEYSSKGKGPGEFISPVLIPQTHYHKNNLLRIYDAAGKSITVINLQKSIEESRYIYHRITMDNDVFNDNYNKVFYHDEATIFYEGGANDSRVSLLNIIDGSVMHIPNGYPDPGFPIQQQHQSYIYSSEVIINPILERIAASPLMIGQIDFFDFNGNHIITSIFDNDKDFDDKMRDLYVNRNVPELKWFIVYMHPFKDHIYALNLDLPSSHIHDLNLSNSEILVFGWDGKPVKKITLDKFVVSFAIDKKHNKIYCFCPYETDNNIICYDL